MRQVNIAVILLKQGNNYLLQHRNGGPQIGAAGTYGSFGGKINDGEEPKAAAIRETAEEANLKVDPGKVEHLGVVKVKSDHQNEPVKVVAHIFHTELGPEVVVEPSEGELVMLAADKIKAEPKLSGVTRATFEELIWR